jgi:dephospho-CoA kinase
MIEVTGQPGVGKNSVVKAAAGYIVERNFFQDGVVILNIDSQISCFKQIAKFVDPNIKSEEDLIKKLKSSYFLFIVTQKQEG